MKRSEGMSEPSRTDLIWAGQICGKCDAPLGDGPVIRVQGFFQGSYLGTDSWRGQNDLSLMLWGGSPNVAALRALQAPNRVPNGASTPAVLLF